MNSLKIEKERDYVYNVLLAEKSIYQQIKLYDNIAITYDEISDNGLYLFPEILTDEFKNFQINLDSKILDVGSGTGRSGKLLKSLGYTNVDALDGSMEMIKYVKKMSGVYKHFIHALVVENEELPIAENSYDVALMSGSASPSHIDVNAYKQIIRVVKPGGLVGWIIEDKATCKKLSSRFQNNYYSNTLMNFVKKKLWVPFNGYNPKLVPNATLLKPGEVYFYKVL
ncbi:malonyl-[acyl-carrier protein] O-methyltransferase-like protein [Leptotrombidium deliense]|uniref:Malonyl-[acyl-carrier protein] O-methyltransferase-like protein n=1 Tax=Leptotrombidium deliense TaxID=299467 RepID=A0A443S713_9ACAR|nr:malonyl-[acyl-carrier protein] O-methyltransferase-like protein [Leptotrombidium deliense]